MTQVGDGIEAGNADWRFDGAVSARFDQHVKKSIPLYHECHQLIAHTSDYFIQEQGLCLEIGCATGALTCLLAQRHQNKSGAKFVGVDREATMVAQAKQRAQKLNLNQVNFHVASAETIQLEPCQLVISHFTFHFLPLKTRFELTREIWQNLELGGAFILFEEIRANDARFQDILNGQYYEFKLEQGYSQEEIFAKKRSLKGILNPCTSHENRNLLKQAGFGSIQTVFHYACFEGLLAIK